eukprot:2384044-Pleurochrysis_carterae.AAC.6
MLGLISGPFIESYTVMPSLVSLDCMMRISTHDEKQSCFKQIGKPTNTSVVTVAAVRLMKTAAAQIPRTYL